MKTIYLIIITIVFYLLLYVPYGTVEWHKTTVSKTDIKKINDVDVYMIYTNDGTYTLEDDMFFLNFSSSDLFGKIQENKTYLFKVNGFRIPILSMYKNIISFKEIDSISTGN